VKECENCGNKENIEYRTDPFQAEIHNDFTEHWLCDKCYKLSLWEI